MSNRIKRSPPTAKRHTKPCRYYQTQSCAKSAEECDFLHVLALTPALSPSKKLCKYFQAGACTNAMHCRFVHATNAGPTADIATPEYVEGDVRYPFKHMHDAGYHYYAVPPPMYAPWSPYAQLPYPSFNPPPLMMRQSSEADSTSSECEHPISSSAASLIVFPTLDSSVSSEDHERGPDTVARRQSSFRYKTKPCKYVQTGRMCPTGDKCTFLHLGEYPPSHSRSLPEKPLSQKEQSMKRGIYPVNWRVIGGGVPLNIQPEHSNREYVQRPYESDIEEFLPLDEEDERSYPDESSIWQSSRLHGGAATETDAGHLYGHSGYMLNTVRPRANSNPARAPPLRPGSV